MILITGITGHSGKYFLEELKNNQYKEAIRCIVRDQEDTELFKRSGLNVDIRVGDLIDLDFVSQSMQGVETVVHIASIFFSRTVMEAAIKNQVKRAIFVHTTGIYSKYKSASEEYQSIERDIQEMIKTNGSDIQLTYLRPTMIYGYLNDRNMIVFIKMVDKLRLFPIISGGKNLLQPVHGRDLGRAYYQVLMSEQLKTGDFILSGERAITLKEMFVLISGFLNKKTHFVHVPMFLAVFGAKLVKLFSINKFDYVEKVLRMGENRHFDHENATKAFGYQPMSFDSGLESEVKEYLMSKR